MANSEITQVLENPKGRAEGTVPAGILTAAFRAAEKATNAAIKLQRERYKDIKETFAVEDDHRSSSIWSPTVEEIHKEESFLQKHWKNIFVASCLCGVLADPLFLYVPIIKDDIKCLLLDQKLKIAAVILRLVTDLFYILDIIFRIYGSKKRRRPYSVQCSSTIRRSCVLMIANAIWGSNDILIDILAILPLPQVAILIFFSNMRDLRSLTPTRMFFMNLFALLQYVPRVLRIYLSCSELQRVHKEDMKQTPRWIKAILNFSMYIIASYVFGAVWYFFAIQRMMDCWQSACRKKDGCDNRTFGCHDHHIFRNITILNDLCPINPSDAKMFDLGIFTSALESGITGSTNYFQKFSNCFWWGLRNLSSLGSNLEPSINGWENLFAASISIIGLLLFLYLIGNLQMYMQFETAKIEEQNRKLQVIRKTEQHGREIELWLFKNGIPTRSHKEMKLQVMEKVQEAIDGNMNVNLDKILHTLPSDFQSRIQNSTPLHKLKQMFDVEPNEIALKIICQLFKPKKFKKNDIIIGEGDRHTLVFIVDGLVSVENSDDNYSQRSAGEICYLHRQSLSAKAIGDVEALVIMDEDIKSASSIILEMS